MAGFELVREDVAGRVILRPKGTLDGSAARLLKGLIADVDPRLEVEVDFSQVREFADVSVGVLTHSLSGRAVHLRGLRSHQERMFQYFGIPTDTRERAYWTPEELLVA
jgi:hypothetical protein